ncbi:hypothetical protein [Pseudoalteromonas phenolica]|nr:hypothetical protein [Pseudoalteromonas phenolica]
MMKFFLIILISFITACSSVYQSKFDEQIPVSSYVGRGTNSGPMLIGALGATGLAVGIAIDQGIAKDFDASIKSHQPSFHIRIQDSLNTLFLGKPFSIEKISFTGVRGNDDLVDAIVTFTSEDDEIKHQFVINNIDFNKLKTTPIFWQELESSILKSIEK